MENQRTQVPLAQGIAQDLVPLDYGKAIDLVPLDYGSLKQYA